MSIALSESAAKRIVRAVRASEAAPQDRAGRGQAPDAQDTKFYAELTGEDASNAGRYSFKKQIPDQFLMEDDPAFSVVTDFTAWEINKRSGLTVGTIVSLTFVGYNGAGNGIYVFDAGGSSIRFGKATATWASGNTVNLAPVVSETDATETGEPNVLAKIFSPERGLPVNVRIEANDIVAYVPTGDGAGILINPHTGASNDIGDVVGQIPQMTSSLSYAWQFPRSHA